MFRGWRYETVGTILFWIIFEVEGQGQSLPKTITKVLCTSRLNLVVLAWTWADDELWGGQARARHTGTRTQEQTDAGNDDTQRQYLASGKKRNFDSTCIFPEISIVPINICFLYIYGNTSWIQTSMLLCVISMMIGVISMFLYIINLVLGAMSMILVSL